jgi:hypothetical protein
VTHPAQTAQTFRTLALLYLVSNARYGSGLTRRRLQRVVTRPEREAITAVVESLPDVVDRWSDGLAGLVPLDVVEVRRPLGSLSSSGGGSWWAGPRDCRQEIEELDVAGRYDSVIVLWPSSPEIRLCGWGCTVGPSDATGGAGFSSIATDHWPSLATDPDPAQGYVHEWLHQVEAVYRGLGVSEATLPGLHDAGSFTSTRDPLEPPYGRSYAEYHDGSAARAAARTWAPWYRDWMTGRLRRLEFEAGPIGLTPERWALRSSLG